MVELIRFEPRMIEDIVALFRNTILTVNRQDYTAEQVKIWADNKQTHEQWVERLKQSLTYVAELDGELVGFGNLTKEGLIDLLYVHQGHQAKGIGTRILNQLEIDAQMFGLQRLETEASITAKPFFLVHGFRLHQEQTKTIEEIDFINYRMIKTI